MSGPNRPMTLVTGGPGGGKSFSAAYDLLSFPGSAVVLDPHKHSLGELVLAHSTGPVLYDRLDDPRYALGYGLLRPSRHPDPAKRYEENLAEAEIFVEIMVRQQGADSLDGSPQKSEWLMAALMLFLTQGDY